MGHGKVASRSHVVHVLEEISEITEVGRLRRANASSTGKEIIIEGVGRPLVGGSPAGAVVMLFRVFGFVQRERGRGGLAVDVAGAGPVAVLEAGDIFIVCS